MPCPVHLRIYKFIMLMNSLLLQSVHPGDWFTSINLKDAYFNVNKYPPHKKLLRFRFEAIANKFLVLPFRLSLVLSPKLWSRVWHLCGYWTPWTIGKW